jgi:hypothetical protein
VSGLAGVDCGFTVSPPGPPRTSFGHMCRVLRRAWARHAGTVINLAGVGQTQASGQAMCPQCGRDRVDTLRTTGRLIRLSCRACGAVMAAPCMSSSGRPPGRISQEVQTAPGLPLGPPPSDPLTPYVTPIMLVWVRGSSLRAGNASKLDKASLYGIWKDFDRFLEKARTDVHEGTRYAALADQLGTLREVPNRLPSFGEIVGLLHSYCYDGPDLVASLTDKDVGPTDVLGLTERVRCASRWLAGPGRGHCWIERQTREGPVDTRNVHALITEGGLRRPLDPEERRVLFAAAFGTSGGPQTAMVIDRFGPERIRQSLETHLRDGSHPLRQTVLAALDHGGDLGGAAVDSAATRRPA